MSTTPNRPSTTQQIAATLKRCLILVGVLAVLVFGYQAGELDARSAHVQSAVPAVPVIEPREDDPGFDCRIHGNEVCGPTGEHTPGCYRDGVLVMPWSDELRGLVESPCGDVVGTYDVPGGALTVFDDGSARFVPVAGEAGSLVGGDGVVAGDVGLGS